MTEPAATLSPNEIKEAGVRAFLSAKAGGSFLEVGIGAVPRIERLRGATAEGTTYLGIDFESVAAEHVRRIRKAGLGSLLDDGSVQYRTNSSGTYNYTLVKLLMEGRRFDAIYLDGAHTLNIDLPAALLCADLLHSGGLFALDDVYWTLSKLARRMHDDFRTWLFYKDMYRFEEHNVELISQPAIKLIIEEILIPYHGFEYHPELNRKGWAVLRKKP